MVKIEEEEKDNDENAGPYLVQSSIFISKLSFHNGFSIFSIMS